MTLISAPFGKVGGAGPHFRSPEFIGIFISLAIAVLAHARTKTKTVHRRGMISLHVSYEHHRVPMVNQVNSYLGSRGQADYSLPWRADYEQPAVNERRVSFVNPPRISTLPS